MPTIPDMIRSGRGEYSSGALLRDGVQATGIVMFAEDRLAAADRIDALEAALHDIACGRGMMGVSLKDDLAWAMQYAGSMIKLEDPDEG